MITDESPMPWGEHKGKKLKDVPASYLSWCYQQTWIKDWRELYTYLKSNEKALELETQEENAGDDGREGYENYEDYLSDRGH